MSIVCGVDGCRAGWVVISRDVLSGEVSWFQVEHFAALSSLSVQPMVVAVDIPIGLTRCGPRECDLAARKLLGQPRGSSVFPAPIRPILNADSYTEACRIRNSVDGKKISKQAWGIIPKIREVDEVLSSGVLSQKVVHEVHPEICFYYLAGKKPMAFSKKKLAGRSERVSLIEKFYPEVHAALSERKSLGSAQDDILDAFVALWSAERILVNGSVSLSPKPPLDDVGLRMEIVV